MTYKKVIDAHHAIRSQRPNKNSKIFVDFPSIPHFIVSNKSSTFIQKQVELQGQNDRTHWFFQAQQYH